MAKVNQVNNLDFGSVARTNWNEALRTVATDASINGDGTLGAPLSNAIIALDNRVIVKVASDFGVIDSTKQYFLDGIIDMGSTTIEIPPGGMSIVGYTFDTSGLISTAAGFDLFTSPVGGSGNLILTDMLIDISGVGSKVFQITDATGFNAIEISRVNFNNCSSLGEMINYRQGLENGTGRFGGTPELTLSGLWVGGWFTATSIVRGLIDGAYSLFKAGPGFSMLSRFRTDMNADMNVTISIFDFSPANFPNPSTCQMNAAIITRLGVFNSLDPTLIPNMLPSDLSASWTNNQGLLNTFEGGVLTLSTEVVTPIAVQNVSELLLGTFTPSDLQHFDTPLQYQLRHIGNDPVEYTVDFNFVIAGQSGDLYTVDLVLDNGAPSIVFMQARYVQASPGPNDLGLFSGSVNVLLAKNDFVYWQVTNTSSASGCTLQLDSTWSVRTR